MLYTYPYILRVIIIESYTNVAAATPIAIPFRTAGLAGMNNAAKKRHESVITSTPTANKTDLKVSHAVRPDTTKLSDSVNIASKR
jgi:hypothetical protein